MKDLNLFFDCEFTHLQEGMELPVLVSIGVVSDCGKTFYAENSNVQEELCSEFVIETVLPLLQGGEALMSYAQIAASMKAWIEAFGVDVQMLSDAPYYDWPHVEHLFDIYGWPNNLMRSPVPLSFASGVQNIRFFNAVEEMFRSNKSLRRHHALDDAIANMRAFKTATMRNY